MKNQKQFILRFLCIFFSGFCILLSALKFPVSRNGFSSIETFSYLADLQANGARVPGSTAHLYSREYLADQMRELGWTVDIQSGMINGHEFHNIYARHGSGPMKLLLGSHYDSRLVADQDLDSRLRNHPVPGVNDGGSSTAILLELARILPPGKSEGIGIAFFDIEDQGNIPGWQWILGSMEFVKSNSDLPEKMVLVDMVGGHLQTIQPPENSNREMYQEIQTVATDLGYGESFLDPSKRGIIDDHVPFYEAGVSSVDLIDIIDPYWHTTSDDLENVNLNSLQKAGETLFVWIMTHY